MGGRFSRDKGNRFEVEVVNALQELGIAAERWNAEDRDVRIIFPPRVGDFADREVSV